MYLRHFTHDKQLHTEKKVGSECTCIMYIGWADNATSTTSEFPTESYYPDNMNQSLLIPIIEQGI